MLTEAIKAKYPVDCIRPVTILSEFYDYSDIDISLPLELTFCIPLSEEIVNDDTMIIPPRTVLTFALSKGMDYRKAMDDVGRHIADNNLKQIDTIAATFEIGRHLDISVKDTGYLFHIMIPCEEV